MIRLRLSHGAWLELNLRLAQKMPHECIAYEFGLSCEELSREIVSYLYLMVNQGEPFWDVVHRLNLDRADLGRMHEELMMASARRKI